MRKIRTRPYRELRAKMSPASRARAEKQAKELLAEMPLCEVRHAREMSQKRLAEVLRINQASVSKLERRTDMYISTLRSFIEAMGGQLEIKAIFPDGAVRISQFEKLGETPQAQ
ncbi:MAG TPA: XRE family transcriptional regulator [Candidatus Deferrimicrobiaceae bacterium]|nr:XRE family transcriptional regulator [Candidatus Deferrimicrobiaceae bacterium]